jgi:hypothetical protein
MRQVRNKAGDLWTNQEKIIIDKYAATETVDQLKARLPNKSKRAIQGMRSRRGITVSKTLRSQIGKDAQSSVNHDKRLRIRFDLTWGDLPNHAQQLFLGSMLGDGGVYRKRDRWRYHYYAESHGKDQEAYLKWKRSMLPAQFEGGWCYLGNTRKPNWTTPSHPIFNWLNDQFYIEGSEYKCKISAFVAQALNEFGLLIWFLDDGHSQILGGRPYLDISTPRWRKEDLERICSNLNSRLALHLYVKSYAIETRINIPAEDRDQLLPVWWKLADEYDLSRCMRYKIPKYELAAVGGRLGGKPYGYRIVESVTGGKKLEPDPAQQKLIHEIIEMRRKQSTLSQISDFLRSQGHYLSTKAIGRLLKRNSLALV